MSPADTCPSVPEVRPSGSRRYIVKVDGTATFTGPEHVARQALKAAITKFGEKHVTIEPEVTS